MGQSQSENYNGSSHLKKAIVTGFVGGLFWSTIWMMCTYFNFVEISLKAYLIYPWTRAEWTSGWMGNTLSILMFSVISIGVAILYYGLFRKRNTMWVGIGYGIALWLIVFTFLNSLLANVSSFQELNHDTRISSLALFIFYGVFVGYSISFDYNDNRSPIQSENKKDKSN